MTKDTAPLSADPDPRSRARVIPFSENEAIIEPFWDRHLSGLPWWQMGIPGSVTRTEPSSGNWWEDIPGTIYVYNDGCLFESDGGHGLKVFQTWCNVSYEWVRKPADGCALKMKRTFDLEVSGYDTILCSMTVPEGAELTVTARTDRGDLCRTFPASPTAKREYPFPLEGAVKLESLTLELHTSSETPCRGVINWIGLSTAAGSSGCPGTGGSQEDWVPWLKPDTVRPAFTPRYGLMISREETEELQRMYSGQLEAGAEPPCVRTVREDPFRNPEGAISTHVKLWKDNRFIREADHGKELLGHGYRMALAAAASRDAALLRLAARYALSIAVIPNWHDSFICHFPGSNFEHKAFVASLCSFESAVILDLAWDLFTEPGRQLIMRRIGESGMGILNWIIWKHGEKPEEIFKMNQLAWFTPGRMAGCLMLEKEFHRVRPYTDLCFQDLTESIREVILPDGGYTEGPSYFSTVAQNAALSIRLYARGRDRDFLELMPPELKKTADFIEAFESTDSQIDVIPVSDSRPMVEIDYPLYMAVLIPESRWTALYHKIRRRTGGRPDSVMGELLDGQIPAEPPARRPFVHLPVMGVMTSQRMIGSDMVKILIPGNHETCYHSHEDKGSFILEWAGDTFAMDPGIGDYADPRSALMSLCDRHNMLVPTGTAMRAAPVQPLPHPVKPEGSGDGTRFCAAMDLTPGWERFYRFWKRRWDSPSPGLLTITDEYELTAGEGAAFLWNTSLPVILEEDRMVIEGERGLAEITIPEGTIARLESLAGAYTHNRITFEQAGRSGRLTVEVRLSLKEENR